MNNIIPSTIGKLDPVVAYHLAVTIGKSERTAKPLTRRQAKIERRRTAAILEYLDQPRSPQELNVRELAKNKPVPHHLANPLGNRQQRRAKDALQKQLQRKLVADIIATHKRGVRAGLAVLREVDVPEVEVGESMREIDDAA